MSLSLSRGKFKNRVIVKLTISGLYLIYIYREIYKLKTLGKRLSPPFGTLLYFTMTLLIKISVMCLAIYAVAAIPLEGQQNKPKISEEDLEIALKDSRYIKKQLTCALENIKCDSVGRRLKSLAPLVLRGNCPQCSPDETLYIRKVLSHVQREYPVEWSRLLQKYSKF